MPWLDDNGDDSEFSRFEQEDAGDSDEILEETEEEVMVTERPGTPVTAPLPAASARPNPKKPTAPKKRAARPAKARATKKKKKAKEAAAKKPAPKSRSGGKRRKKR
jgi:hypothetical protein